MSLGWSRKQEENSKKAKFVVLATKNGVIKKTDIASYETIRKTGIIAIKLSTGDLLRWAKLTSGDDVIFLVSKKGLSIKFLEKDVRPMARDTMGVRGIKIKPGDELICMDVIEKEDIKSDLLVITEKGIGKKTSVSAWPTQLRGGVGVKAANLADKTGDIVNAQILTKDDEGIILTSKKGQVMRTTLRSVPRLTRDTQGVIIMRLSGDDKIAAATVIQKKKGEEEIESETKKASSQNPKEKSKEMKSKKPKSLPKKSARKARKK